MATTDFSALIQGLKKDLQSLPSCGTPSIHAPVPPAMDGGGGEDTGSVASDSSSMARRQERKKHGGGGHKDMVNVIFFVRHGMIPGQFFLFFLILLACLRPSFLYYHETNTENRIRSHFSFWYLFCYSVFFSILFMGMIHLQKWILESLLRRP
jgi:hypothetical protein